jgi:hypothetical protein
MAHYLVKGKLKEEKREDLLDSLADGAFAELQPFGESLTYSLENARKDDEGRWVWEELDYCDPPLKQERKQVLDRYFSYLDIERVDEGEGWRRIESLPRAHDIVSS